MDKGFPQLFCPYCARELADSPGALPQLKGLGTLACRCQTYPVVDGIPILRAGAAASFEQHVPRIAQHVRAGRREQALVEAVRLTGLSLMPQGPMEQALGSVQTIAQAIRDRLAGRRLRRYARKGRQCDLRTVLRFLRPPRYADYLYYRQANPSYFAIVAGAMLLASAAATKAREEKPFHVLDLACGVGHSTFLLGQFMPNARLLALDNDFTNLHVGTRFMPPGAARLCADAESPLPFGPAQFDAIFCADALHYVRSKAALAGEMKRVLKPDGMIVIPHLHNALAHNPSAGMPLIPQDYARLFEPLSVRVCAESALVDNLVDHNLLDLREQADLHSLSSEATLFLAASPRDCWPALTNADGGVPITSLRVNPAYEAVHEGQTVSLTLRGPGGRLGEEFAQGLRHLPARLGLNHELYRRIQQGEAVNGDAKHVRELARRFVLVHLPEAYAPSMAEANGNSRGWHARASRLLWAMHVYLGDAAPDFAETAGTAFASVV